MQLCGMIRLLVQISWFCRASGLVISSPKDKHPDFAPVPIPMKPTAELPKPPNGHPGGPASSAAALPVHCKKLDACFSSVKATDQVQSAAMFRTCIQRFCDDLHSGPGFKNNQAALCDDKGKKAWDVLAKAQAEIKVKLGDKVSLVTVSTHRPDVYASVLQILFADRADAAHSMEECQLATPAANSSPHLVPVPAKPTVKLPQPSRGHPGGHIEKNSVNAGDVPVQCKRLDKCFADAKVAEQAQSAGLFKSCIQSFCNDLHAGANFKGNQASLCDDKGKKAWDLLSKAQAEVSASQGHKVSLVDLQGQRPDTYTSVLQILFAGSSDARHYAESCEVPVPAKPDIKLPQPSNGQLTSPAKVAADPKQPVPMHCERLDVCFSKVESTDEAKSAAKFKQCIERFCNDLHAGKKLNKSDDRTALCDEKGKESWDLIARAQAQVKAKSGHKAFLLDLKSEHSGAYAKVLQLLFADRSIFVRQVEACQLGVAVPVPTKPTVELPQPSGRHLGKTTSSHDDPMRCKKLDMCFSTFGESSAGFKACIVRFCEKLSAESLENPSNSVLCKNNGEKAWEILSKVHKHAEVSKEKRLSFVDSLHASPMLYQEVMQELFTHGAEAIYLKDACQV
jgi:hypothetical protein